jgi:5-methylcytosine-specific restriction endonuclease McrA
MPATVLTAMPRLSSKQRSSPDVANDVIDSVFEGISGGAKRSYRAFLTASIEYLSQHHPDRWGVTLFDWGVRLNVGWVECLVLDSGALCVLIEKESAPPGTKFVGRGYAKAPGCAMTRIVLSELPRALRTFVESHRAALSIAAKYPPPANIRNAHSVGITKALSVPNPQYARPDELHIVQGGIANGDKRLLERAARGRQLVQSWVVPKSATIGDEVVIYISGYGLFATGRVKSRSEPRADWPNKYGAALDSVKLIKTPISLAVIRRHVPNLEWAKYPRSVTTPQPEVADQIRQLINQRRKSSVTDLDDRVLESANIDELRIVALLRARSRSTPKERQTIHRAASRAIRLYVLVRAKGCCEGCKSAAPFHGADGSPFLEAHHTKRLADEGPDHPGNVIGLCPNCHRRAHFAKDKKTFNAALKRSLPKLEADAKKG